MKPIDNPAAYMYRMVKNEALNRIKANKKYVQIDENVEYESKEARDILDIFDITRALDELDEVDREIAIMIYIYDLPLVEVSKEIGMPLRTLKWHKKRIREKLAEYFDK